MNLIKRFIAKLHRKPLLVKPVVINRSYSIEALEVMFLAGFTEGRMNCPVCGHKPEDWKILFEKHYCGHKPEDWKILFEKHYKWTFKND